MLFDNRIRILFIQKILFVMLTITICIFKTPTAAINVNGITNNNNNNFPSTQSNRQNLNNNAQQIDSNQINRFSHNQMFIKQLLEQVSKSASLSNTTTSIVPKKESDLVISKQNKRATVQAFNANKNPELLSIKSMPKTANHHQQQKINLNYQKLLTTNNNNNHSNISFNLVKRKWLKMEKSIGESLEFIGINLKTTIADLIRVNNNNNSSIDYASPLNISLDCEKSLLKLANGLIKQQLWASKFVDASARLPAGLLEGTLTELGNFDQCLAIKSASTEEDFSEINTINGQYCSFIIKPVLLPRPRLHTVCQRMPAILPQANYSTSSTTLTNSIDIDLIQKPFKLLSQNSHQFYYSGLRLGMCLPNLCSRFDIQKLLTAYLNKFELVGQVKSCQVLAGQNETSGAGQDNSNNPVEQFDLVQQCIM